MSICKQKLTGVAQLVEHRSPKPSVVRSSRTSRAKFYLKMSANFLTKTREGLKESYNELVHKVSWPTRSELTSSAVVVLVASIILALVVLVMDTSFEWIMTQIYEKLF